MIHIRISYGTILAGLKMRIRIACTDHANSQYEHPIVIIEDLMARLSMRLICHCQRNIRTIMIHYFIASNIEYLI